MNRYLMRIEAYFSGYKYFEVEAENKQDAITRAKEYCKKHSEYSIGGNYKLDSITCVKKVEKKMRFYMEVYHGS